MSTLYVKPVTKDEQILLLLKEVLHHNIDVCQTIMKYKNNTEQQETMDYNHDGNNCTSHFTLHIHEESSPIYLTRKNMY